MNTPPKDGGPAFPRPAVITPQGVYVSESEIGMSMRDWFAGQALAGILASRHYSQTQLAVDGIAKTLFEMADAMLKARQQ